MVPPRPLIKKWTGQPFRFAHVKHDGHLLYVRRTVLGVECWTRRPRDIYQSLRWHPLVARAYELYPAGTELMGELYLPGQPASQVKTAIKEQNPGLRFVVFAVPSRPEWPLGYAASHVQTTLLTPFAAYSVNPYRLDQTSEISDWVDRLIEEHRLEEGLVLKQSHMDGWFKVKRSADIDLVVTGVKTAREGKFFGLIGSLVCSTSEGHEVASVSGMSDDTRIEMSLLDHAELIGRVCEVQYQRVDSGGRLRHPRFKRWRDDEKRPEDCGLRQDTDLETYWSRR